MSRPIRYAVFPVAGKGTRFLPATKANPKEMLPIVDKPLIQYAVEEAVAAGATNLVFITGRHKRAIEDHFDEDHELVQMLEQQQKHELRDLVANIVPPHANCIFLRQGTPLGLGHAVLCARPVVGKEPFFVHLADDLIDADVPCLGQMRDVYERTSCSVIGVEEIPVENTGQYGIVAGDPDDEGVFRLSNIVEKPKPEEAPSNLAVVGRYILMPEIFDCLEHTGRGAGGEIQLTDAIADLLKQQSICAHAIDGKRFDCGSKLGYLEATVYYALKHHALGDDFRNFLQQVARQD